MNLQLFFILLLSIGLSISCEKPIKVFQIVTDGENRTIELYEDSSFVEKINKIEDSCRYYGIWSGKLNEGSIFRTIATKKNLEILTLTPKHEYRIKDGQAIENTQPIFTFSKTTIWRIDSLKIPECQICDEMKMSMKKLFGNEINIGDNLIMTENNLFHRSYNYDTISTNNYSIDTQNLEIFGSDWSDIANVVDLDHNRMILLKTQQIIYEIENKSPPNDLIIYLKKVK